MAGWKTAGAGSNTTSDPHIELDERGVARFGNTRFKIIHVILEHTRWKWSAEAIQLQHPDLTLGQIHSALAYYFDHQTEIETQIEESEREIERLRKETEHPELQAKLRRLLDERLGLR